MKMNKKYKFILKIKPELKKISMLYFDQVKRNEER